MPESGATSPGRGPAPIPFDPKAGGGTSDSLASIVPDVDRWPALLVVAGEDARTDGWAGQAAVTLASSVSERRENVLLADLVHDGPGLHDLLGVPNDEGLADVFHFGASLHRVARPVADHAFRYAPTGAYVPDPEALLSHARWERLIDELAEAGDLLIAYVPAGAPGLTDLARRIGHALILARSDEEAEAIVPGIPYACSVEAILTPPSVGAEAPASAADDGAGAVEDPAADPEAASADSPDAEGNPPTEDELIRELAVIHRESERRRSTRVVLGLILVAVLAVAGWYVLGGPGAEGAAEAGEPEPSGMVSGGGETGGEVADVEPTAVPGPMPIDSPLPYSVVVESHEALAPAQERVDGLRETQPDVAFYIAPVLVDDNEFYRVLAGPVSDSSGAAALVERLVETGVKDSPEPWSIRTTPQAFHLGDFHTADAARARARELGADGIPAYMVEVPFDAGSPRYRLYGGAYQGVAEARLMERLLGERQLDAELVRRIGRSVS